MASPVDTSAPRKHVLMVNFPTFGHMIPLLELAKKISKFHDVTFAVPAAKVPQLKDRELIRPSDSIEIFAIQDGVVDDFDDPTDSAAAKRVFEGTLPAIAALLTKVPVKHGPTGESSTLMKPVDVAIVDQFCGGPAAVLAQRGAPYYVFHSANALMVRVLLALNENSPTVPDSEADPFLRMPEDGKPAPLPESMKKLFLSIRNSLHLANGHIINSVRTLDEDSCAVVEKDRSMAGKPVYFVGPLLPDEKASNSTEQLLMEKKVTAWLDRQTADSVVYVSFGSVATPRPEQLQVLGHALRSLGQPVVWAIREKYHVSLPKEIAASIPGQFEDPDNKLLVVNWAPQKLILAHKSIGVFLTHGGWNSTIEAFSTGTPLVTWPMFADQLLNGQWVGKLGAGLMLPDTGILPTARIVPEDEIREIIKKVGGWSTGGRSKSSYALAAKDTAAKLHAAWIPGRSSYTEFSNLIKFDHSTK